MENLISFILIIIGIVCYFRSRSRSRSCSWEQYKNKEKENTIVLDESENADESDILDLLKKF